MAVAVPDRDAASARWVGELGGGTVAHDANRSFAIRQLRYAGGGKLELLAPPPGAEPSNFVARFLAGRGAGIHHVTLKVTDLHAALRHVEGRGLDVVDVQDTHPFWREGFLRPSQVGGLIVQIAWQAGTDEQWAAHLGLTPQPPRADAARLLGARLSHTDLDTARNLWSTLGAEVSDLEAKLLARWPNSPLSIEIVEGDSAGPLAVRMDHASELPRDRQLGAPVVVD